MVPVRPRGTASNSRQLAAITLSLALAGCTSGGGGTGSGNSLTDAQTRAACRQRADQVYEQQNRGAIYSPQSGVNTPSSASYAPGVTDRGLADLFAHDTMIRDCVRNTGAETDRGEAPGLLNTP